VDEQLLDLYSDYLISSFGQTTATGLSALLEGRISHDRITRGLASRPLTSRDLWKRVKPLARQIQEPDGVLIFDDSVEEKPSTDESPLICWHFDHTKGKTVKGINVLSALYHSRGVSLPVAFELVLKTKWETDKKTGKQKRVAEVTKHEQYRQMLHTCVKNGLLFRYVLNDTWFASAENMVFVKESCKKDFVMPLKANRKVALSQEEKQHGRYVTVSELSLEENTLRRVWVEQVPFPLLLSRHVFKNEDGSEGVLYLVSSDPELTAVQMRTIYQRRWKVEEYHKSLKSNLAFARSPAQRLTCLNNHIFACLWAFVKLEGLRVQTKLNHFALKNKLLQAAVAHA
jgi:IS4 transposase